MTIEILKSISLEKPPGDLFHYTTGKGLLGIFNDKEIWATHTQYLNDQAEFKHALEIARNILKSKIDSTQDGDVKEIFVKMLGDFKYILGVYICVCS